MGKVDLSVIITAHSEGLLAHKTMLSIFKAAEILKKHRVSYEIIIHIDKGTAETISYFKRYQKDPLFTIYQNTFGDLGESRNFAAQKADGEIISFLDADDLVSPNWYYEAYKFIKKSEAPILVHPEANLTFGTDLYNQVLWMQHDSKDKASDALILAGANRWASSIAGPKNVFLKYPYPKTADGYGNEDYWFNTQTIAAGVLHHIVPETIQFYRRKQDSLLTSSANANHIQRYTDLLDISYFQSFQSNDEGDKAGKRSIYQTASKMYRALRKNKGLDKILTPLAYNTVRALNYLKRSNVKVPDFVMREWTDARTIETQLYPTTECLKRLKSYDSDADFSVGLCYYELVKNLKHLPDYVFIVPWVVAGGADKVLINYLKAFQNAHPKWHIAVITTLPSENAWAKFLPGNTELVDFGNLSKMCKLEDYDWLFSRLITQLKCKKLHIINSEFAYNWVAAHQELVAKNYHLNVSLFCYDIIPNTSGKGFFDYADPYLVNIYPVVNHIYTDNQAVIDRVIEKNGFDAEKLTVEYQPIDIAIREPEAPKRGEDGKIHILWASRISEQKNPELLKKIAEKLSPDKYQIDVYGRIDGEYGKGFFSDTPVINYHGAYNEIESLDLGKYQLFLYTSLIDGVPNILLEIAALGLPIIASDAGGVKEFIKERKTGRLITDYNNAEAYVEAIKDAAKNPEQYMEYAKAAQKLLKKQHSFEVYLEQIRKDF